MGIDFCGFRDRANNPERSSKKDAENGTCGLAVMKLMKPSSLWAALKVRKRQFHRPGKHEVQLYKNNCKVLTLEDWLMSSPDFSKTNYTNINGDDMVVPKQSSRRIHPSFGGNLKEEFLPTNIDNKGDEAENEEFRTRSFGRTKGGKLKKVSFRSPEVADVFVLDSPKINTNDQMILIYN